MQTTSGSPGLYEHILTISLLLFLKSLRLYPDLGKCARTNPKFVRNAKIQSGLKNIIATIETSGNGMKRLPAPPPGVELVDQRFRDLGWEICGFASVLKQLASSVDIEDVIQITIDFQERATMIKENFRAAIYGFDTIYPGRLTQVLQSHVQSLLD